MDTRTLNLPRTVVFTRKEDPNIEGLKRKHFLLAFGFLWVLELQLGTVGELWLFLGCLSSVMGTKIPEPLTQQCPGLVQLQKMCQSKGRGLGN